jgi:hypothetical protein
MTCGLVDRYRLRVERVRLYNLGRRGVKYVASTETSIILLRVTLRITEEDNYRIEVHYGIVTR